MKIEDIKKDDLEKKSVMISVRTYLSYSKWMKENEVSPTKLFNKAIEELMKNEKQDTTSSKNRNRIR